MEDNMKILKDAVIISINPKLYPLDIIYSAAYVFLDKAYILLDGNPEKVINIKIKPKTGNPKSMGLEFLNELINYGDYKNRAKETKTLRESLLQKALVVNDPLSVKKDELEEFLDDVEDDYIDDPEGIAIPWEEKYGKEK